MRLQSFACIGAGAAPGASKYHRHLSNSTRRAASSCDRLPAARTQGGAGSGGGPWQEARPAPAAAIAQRLAAGAAALALSLAAAAVSLPAPAQALEGGLALALPSAERFNEDRRQALDWLREYQLFVLAQSSLEQAPGCELCRAHRKMLEQTWETVANDFLDPAGTFSQGQWARQLLESLQAAGGVLRTEQEAYTALRDMIATLGDRHSEYLSPPQLREALRRPTPAERLELAVQGVGTGVVLGERSPQGCWSVEAAMAGSPAEEAGVQRGDCLQAVAGRLVGPLAAAEVEATQRTRAGTQVQLQLLDAAGATRQVDIVSRRLAQPPIRQADLATPAGSSIAYIRIHYFDAAAARAVERAVREAEQRGASAYVLDLRNNPGGSFNAAVSIATFFLPRDALVTYTVYTWFGGEEVAEWRVGQLVPEDFPSLPGLLSSRPLVLLVNSSTASASEMVAGALRDNGRAVLVGQPTYGKGSIQDLFEEPDGSGLRLTIGAYLTPAGYDISLQGGLQPDVVCADHPRSPGAPPDTCMVAALQILEQRQ